MCFENFIVIAEQGILFGNYFLCVNTVVYIVKDFFMKNMRCIVFGNVAGKMLLYSLKTYQMYHKYLKNN